MNDGVLFIWNKIAATRKVFIYFLRSHVNCSASHVSGDDPRLRTLERIPVWFERFNWTHFRINRFNISTSRRHKGVKASSNEGNQFFRDRNSPSWRASKRASLPPSQTLSLMFALQAGPLIISLCSRKSYQAYINSAGRGGLYLYARALVTSDMRAPPPPFHPLSYCPKHTPKPRTPAVSFFPFRG